MIFIIDTENFAIQHVIRNLENTAFDLEFSADDHHHQLAALGDCRDIMLFVIANYQLVTQSKAPSMGANSAIFLSDADQILCVGNNCALRLYQLEDQYIELIYEKRHDHINPEPFHAAYNEKNGLIALGFLNGTYLELLNVQTVETVYKPRVTDQMKRSQSLLHTLAWSEEGHSLNADNYKADGKGDLIRWNWEETGEPKVIPLDSGVLKINSDENRVFFH